MGNTIFNTFLVKSTTPEQLAEIKSSIIDIERFRYKYVCIGISIGIGISMLKVSDERLG